MAAEKIPMFMKFVLEVGDNQIEGDLAKELMVPDNPEGIAKHMETAAARMFYWGSCAEYVKKLLKDRQIKFEVWMSSKMVETRKLLASEPKASVTESRLKALVIDTNKEEYETRTNQIAELEYAKGMLEKATHSTQEVANLCVNLLSWHKGRKQ